jgi:hypothetical protein
LRKAARNFFSVYLSVRLQQFSFHWTDFGEILYLGHFRKSVAKKLSFIKIRQKRVNLHEDVLRL